MRRRGCHARGCELLIRVVFTELDRRKRRSALAQRATSVFVRSLGP